MGYCTECGFRLPDDAIYCPACGTPVRREDGPAAGETQGEAGTWDGGNEKARASAGTYPPPRADRKSGGGKTAAIVIALVVVLFAAAGYLLDKAVDKTDFKGYWESTAVEVNGLQRDSYFGSKIDGLFGVQINEDGTASMCSAFTQRVFNGKWTKTSSGLVIRGSGEEYELIKKDGKLYMFNNGLFIIYSPAKGDIDHPSVAHGSLAKDDGSASASPLPSPDAGESSGYVDGQDYEIAITGAEAFKDENGKDAVRVYFTYVNHSDHSESAWDTLDFIIRQNGSELRGESEQSDTDAGRLLTAMVRPGVKIQCCYTFVYNPKGGDVAFTIQGWDRGGDGGTVSRSFTPGELPGAPAPLVITPVTEPKWTTKLPGEGKLDDAYTVSVESAELTVDENAQPAVRIRYRFENDSSVKVSLSDALRVFTYQDGVSLEEVNAAKPTDSDMAFYKMVDAGASAEVSCVFHLRNTSSQVEAEVESIEDYDALGQTYSVKG